MSQIVCVICKNEKNDDDYIQPRQIGIDTINRVSKERGDKLNVVIGDYVDVNCRKEYINKWYITEVAKKNQSDADKRKTRRSQPAFDFKTKCFFCEHVVTTREKQTKAASEVLSKYGEIDKSVTESIKSRSFDEWALLVFGRLEGISDLHAEDAVYHHTCYSNFKTNRKIPSKYQDSGEEVNRKRGRPKDELLDDIYDEVCRTMQDMEKNDGQITVPDLAEKMAELAAAKGRTGCYDARYLKKRIQEDFKGQIVITFRSTAFEILQDFQKRKASDDVEVEK